jgi:hypothetical protein
MDSMTIDQASDPPAQRGSKPGPAPKRDHRNRLGYKLLGPGAGIIKTADEGDEGGGKTLHDLEDKPLRSPRLEAQHELKDPYRPAIRWGTPALPDASAGKPAGGSVALSLQCCSPGILWGKTIACVFALSTVYDETRSRQARLLSEVL